MKLHKLRICNFQSFGPEPTEILLDDLIYLIGPNGSGKTALLIALCRLFAYDPNLRKVQASDFYCAFSNELATEIEEQHFWIEADFIFPELEDPSQEHSTIPPYFRHMRINDGEVIPRVRFRLDAVLYDDGELEDSFTYVLDIDASGNPITQRPVPRSERNNIHVHYLPARRDPAKHISYTATSLLGRALRAVNWQDEREEVHEQTRHINSALSSNIAIQSLSTSLMESWQQLHSGSFFTSPKVTFSNSEIESLLRHLSVSFSPGHGTDHIDFSRLSDGQQSMLYLSLVVAMHHIGQTVLSGENNAFDLDKLKPPIFTLIAMEEPENSLSPHYLGRVVKTLQTLANNFDGQVLIATHSPSMLKRIAPEAIRYMRLNEVRQTQVKTIAMPEIDSDAYKYVKEAVEAFPELYFSRLVVLGEGDSEEIVLPRLMKAKGLGMDEASVSIVPLGGRHINHFWRLLYNLNIPFITLLDLDLARFGGGWGRIKYVYTQLLKYSPSAGVTQTHIDDVPEWNSDEHKLLDPSNRGHLDFCESQDVFFSSPLDLDFTMLKSYSDAYGTKVTDLIEPTIAIKKIVLGEHYYDEDQYNENEQGLFKIYQKRFKSSSKPASHLEALSNLDDATILANIPSSLERMINRVAEKLAEIPE